MIPLPDTPRRGKIIKFTTLEGKVFTKNVVIQLMMTELEMVDSSPHKVSLKSVIGLFLIKFQNQIVFRAFFSF